MPSELPCESTLNYTYHGQSETGTGATEEAATADAMSKFTADAEANAKVAAINNARERYTCADPCNRDVTVGSASFRKAVTPPTPPVTTFTVVVTIDVPVTLTCRKRTVTTAALMDGDYPVDAFAAFLPPDELDPHDDTSGVIAYVSTRQRKIYTLKGHTKEALRDLEATKHKKSWMLKGINTPFELVETNKNPQLLACKQDEQEEGPQEGERRVQQNRKCGRVWPARTGRCRRLREGLYGRVDERPWAVCRPRPDATCTEFFVEVRRVKFFSDENCTQLIADFSVLGWSCVALF